MIADSVLVMLRQDLPRDVIRKQPKTGMDYVDGHYVITRLNEVFGYDGWRADYGTCTIMPGSPRPIVHVTCTLYAAGTQRTDIGVGIAADARPEAFETALKGAYTDALKRCARTFGASFGLALYEKERTTVGLSTTALTMLTDIEALEAIEDVNGWAKHNARHVEKLDKDEQDAVKGAAAARRMALAEPKTPAAVPQEDVKPARLPATLPRVEECTDAEELVMVMFAFWATSDASAREALTAAVNARANALGIQSAQLSAARADLAPISRDAAAWKTVIEVLSAIRSVTTSEALRALVPTFGAKVAALPKPLKDRLNAARVARMTALAPTSETLADDLCAEAGRATTKPAFVAVYAKLETLVKTLKITPDHAARVVDALNERAAMLPRAA